MFKQIGEYKNPEYGIQHSVCWKSPSNIALVKYWGKKELQKPANPNLSFSLEKSYTKTCVSYSFKKDAGYHYDFSFHGKKMESFRPKLNIFFSRIREFFPFIDFLDMKIDSENTFPHSAGIASSASAMSALSLCLTNIYQEISGDEDDFFQKASFISRLGSGSACRSVYGGFSVWGENSILNAANDEYAVPFHLKPDSYFMGLCDSILIVDEGQKSMSSSQGHGQMEDHPFAGARFRQAEKNLNQLIYALNTENIELFASVIENDALSMHALMMSSSPPNLLLKAGSLSIIKKVRQFRAETGIFVCFTIDAGPNIHLIYHKNDTTAVMKFIEMELKMHCYQGKLIHDGIGNGPEKIS